MHYLNINNFLLFDHEDLEIVVMAVIDEILGYQPLLVLPASLLLLVSCKSALLNLL